MIKTHLILLLSWTIYCILHSVLAGTKFKDIIANRMGKTFKYYRLCYSIFAALSLAGLLLYQFRIDTLVLFRFAIIRYVVGSIFILPGVYIMIACIRKYFYELSGIQALEVKEPVIHLQQEGIHGVVRHPLYFGTLLFVWGSFLIFPTLANLIACVVIHGYVLIGIKWEEKKLLLEFGDEYRSYALKVPGLIPRIRR